MIISLGLLFYFYTVCCVLLMYIAREGIVSSLVLSANNVTDRVLACEYKYFILSLYS